MRSTPGVHWVFDFPHQGGGARSSPRATRLARPLLLDGTVFVRMRTGLLERDRDLLVGFDPLSGAERLSRDLGIIGGPVADEEVVACDGAILVPDRDTLHLIDTDGLALRWTFREQRLLRPSFSASRLAIAESAGVIVAAGTQDRVLGISVRDGSLLWALPQPADAIVAGADRVVLTSGDEVRCLDGLTGALVWGFSCPDVIRCLAHRDGWALLGCRDRHLYSIELDTGTVRHETPLTHAMGTFLCTDGSSAIVTSSDHQAAVELGSGRPLWWARFGSQAHPVLAGSAALVDDGQVLRCLDVATGAERWAVDVTDVVTFGDGRDRPSEIGPPLVTDQVVIVPTNGALIGLGPGGSPSWEPPGTSRLRPLP
ncbi:MAG: PQQ-binding-like beta-propeller repeat protein [Actinomycetota bacterium]